MLAALSLLGVMIPNSVGVATAKAFPGIVFSPLEASQALHFSTTDQHAFGYVTKLTMGTPTPPTVLATSLTLKNPVTAFTAPTVAAGALTSFSWAGGVTDGIVLKFDTPIASSTTLKTAFAGQTKVPVQISLVIYDYNPIASVWYAAVGNTTPVTLTGTTSNLAVSNIPDSSVSGTQVFQVSMTVYPKALTAQTIPLRQGGTTIVVKTWGMSQ
jgi:hypothetical protein